MGRWRNLVDFDSYPLGGVDLLWLPFFNALNQTKQPAWESDAASQASALPPCAFCGEADAPQEIQTGLRVQAETWHVCHRTSCNETIPYHRERLEAGLVDCAETRASTLRWVKERLGSK